MRRVPLLTTAAAAVAATVVPALAAPAPVDAGRVAQTVLAVPLGHGDVLRLDVSAAALTGGDVARIVAQHCTADGGCDSMDVYRSALPDAAFTVDSSTAAAALNLVVAGHDVQLRWRPAGGAGASGGGDLEAGRDSVSARAYDGDNADVAAVVDGRRCVTTGTVGNEVAADSSTVAGSPTAGAVSALRLPDGADITCG